jgi:hypothetical protein
VAEKIPFAMIAYFSGFLLKRMGSSLIRIRISFFLCELWVRREYNAWWLGIEWKEGFAGKVFLKGEHDA